MGTCEGSATPTLATRSGSFGRTSLRMTLRLPTKMSHRGRCRAFMAAGGSWDPWIPQDDRLQHLCAWWAIGAARAAQLNLVDGPYLAYKPQLVRLVAVLDEAALDLILLVTVVVQPMLE